MKYYEINSYGNTYNVRIERKAYANNDTLALSLITEDGEPFCNLTVNLIDSTVWGNSTDAFVDTNNCPWADDFIEQNNLGEPVGFEARSGFCTYPLYRFNLDELDK